jgi:hypothetical protein
MTREIEGKLGAVPVCRRCNRQVGIFLAHGLDWQHFNGDWTTSGAQEIYDPGHPVEVTWRPRPVAGPEIRLRPHPSGMLQLCLVRRPVRSRRGCSH